MTLPILGQALLLLAFGAALVGSVIGFASGRRLTRTDPEAVDVPPALERTMLVVMLSALGASLLLLLALIGSDFTLSYVQERTSRDLSLGFRMTALWSGQEGSLLLWLTVLSGCGALLSRTLVRAGIPAAHRAYALGVVLAVASFFALLVAFVARPFEVVEQLQRDGAGMSPSLQNYWMAIHPPTLYLGYVGVAVPFAIVMGALLSKQRGDAWVGTLRGWVIASWVFLTLGLVLGARWAYEEIGWGGYWAWDPVENAALMPWLTATALMHSIMVQQRRGMMRFWNAVLVTMTFALSIFGTFLTRSGVLSSVHSFVSSPVGWWFIGALVVVLAGSMAVLYRSRVSLRAAHDVDAVVSREGMLLFNNLLLVALALVVLWGVVYPILTASFTEARISLEKPWYDFFAAAFGLPLAFLLAFAPVVAWRGTPVRTVVSRMFHPIAWSAAVAVVLLVRGFGSSPSGLAAVTLGSLVVFGVLADAGRTMRARRSAQPQESRVARALHVLRRHRQRWGAWMAHAGIGLVVIAVAGSAWGTKVSRELEVGDQVRIGGYELELTGVDRARSGAAMQTRAVFELRRGSDDLGEVRAGRDFHPASGEVSNEVGIVHRWIELADVFVTVDRIDEQRTVRVTAFVNPLVPLLWLGGLLTAAGGLVAAWPSRRRRLPADVDTNRPIRVEPEMDAVHELRNGAAAPGELLSSVRRTPGSTGS